MQLPEHGANPKKLYERLGIDAPEKLFDFSENCNPAGPPKEVQTVWPSLLSRLKHYPDPAGEPFLSAAAKFHGVPVERVLAGNGAAELLSLIAERYRGKRALIVHPTFSEYEATLTAKGAEVVRIIASETDGFKLPTEQILEALHHVNVLYLCTPNNPTGVLPPRDELDLIIRTAGETGCEIVLDEAFIDFVDESASFISDIECYKHVIIVRSMTKMYAIPGIRLGYVIAHPIVIESLKAAAPHWNVNGFAAFIGKICLEQIDYRERAIRHATKAREEMSFFLKSNGCVVTDSTANFLSFKFGGQTKELYEHLLEKGMVLRHSENFIGMDGNWLRIGMKGENELHLLKEELSNWFAVQNR
ncbi:threonine-phosphate decarboxylase CobD [Sporosarcina contaminans]|uniref:threonine-phosphate decarboxylase n=1 Tax=Sporosarcina contaminans TaxID=633403 RepID=A0ABW3TY88_9BACL